MATVLRGGQRDTQSEQQRRRGGELTNCDFLHGSVSFTYHLTIPVADSFTR
jgi:hypothetical protein